MWLSVAQMLDSLRVNPFFRQLRKSDAFTDAVFSPFQQNPGVISPSGQKHLKPKSLSEVVLVFFQGT